MSWRVDAGIEGPHPIFFRGHPQCFTEAKIRELLESFGPLRAFNMIIDEETGEANGSGFCAYQDPSVTDIACATLHCYQIEDKKIAVVRATEHKIQSKAEQELQFAMQRLMIQPGDGNGQELQIAMQRLMI